MFNYFINDDLNGDQDPDLDIWDRFFDFGDPNRHTQQLGINYALPLNKIPTFDFINANYSYSGDFQWSKGSDLFGQDLPDETLINAIECVSPGIELHNYTFWHDPPCLQELICSGGIHAGLIVGDKKISPRDLHFKNDIFSVYQDDKLIASAPALEIMGGPLNSLRWLVNSLSSFGEILKEGSLVIPGSPTELISVTHDCDVEVVIQNVGRVSATFIS